MTQRRSSQNVGFTDADPRPRRGRRTEKRPTIQLELALHSRRGGRRAGAGRPPKPGRRQVPHRSRPAHRAECPVHVTLRSACRSLRTQYVFPTVRAAISAANHAVPEHFRIVHFSVQGDHLHLLAEARDRNALLHGIRGLCIRIARRVNRLLFRKGRFFADRWHGRTLASPRAVRHALVYVLANFRKHQPGATSLLDIYSSAPYFREFIEFPCGTPIGSQPQLLPRALVSPHEPVLHAKTWLLSAGWKRHGKLSIAERPAN